MIKLNYFALFLITAAILIFFLAFVLVFDSTRLLQSEDLVAPITTSISIVRQGNIEVGEYYNFLTTNFPNPDKKGDIPYYIKQVGSNYYSAFPFTISFLVVPVSFIYSLFVKDDLDSVYTLGLLSRVMGIFVISLSAGYFYLLAKKVSDVSKFKVSDYKVLLLTIIFVFATNNFSMNAQGIWQHSLSNLLITSAIFYFLNKQSNVSAFLFGLSVAIRPTNLLSLAVFILYLLFKYLKNKKDLNKVFKFAFISVIPIIIEYGLEYKIFGSIKNTGYGSQTSNWVLNFPEGFLGIWLSTSKGILIFSPIFIFIFYYLYIRIVKNKVWYLFDISLFIVLVHTFIMGFWFHWYGGYSWGYRMASDVIPYLTILLIPFLASDLYKKIFIKYLFYSVLIYSVAVHTLGVLVYDTTWHLLFDKGPSNTYWVWSLKDNHIWFSVKRLLYFIGLAKNPTLY